MNPWLLTNVLTLSMVQAIDATISKDSPTTVPIITEIIPDTPAANCPCLWVNDHLLCIKGYMYADTQSEAKQLEMVIAKCTYVQIVVQRAVRTYGPEKTTFIAVKKQKFGIAFTEKKNVSISFYRIVAGGCYWFQFHILI